MKQARSEVRKQAKAKRMEKAAEIQMAIEHRAAVRRLYQELAEMERNHLRWAARLNVRVQPDKPESRTSPVKKRLTLTPIAEHKSRYLGASAASSWVIDDRGMRGVIWQQSYLGRKSPNFYRGAARDNWEYHVRDEAVLLDADGEPVIISNMGEDWIEIGAAWQAMEDASTRKNAKIQILAIAPFDADMSREEMITALRHFCETILAPLQLPYSAVIHEPPEGGDERNFHPHIAFSLRPMRRLEPYCWEMADEVCGELDGKDGVQMLRHLWAHSMSHAAEQAQRNMRYTGLGYGARGLDLETGEHLGEGRSAMVRRGQRVWAHERNRIKNARNAQRRKIRDFDRKIAALTKVRDAALTHLAAEQNPKSWRRATAAPKSPERPRLYAAARKSDPAPRLARARRPQPEYVPPLKLAAQTNTKTRGAPHRLAASAYPASNRTRLTPTSAVLQDRVAPSPPRVASEPIVAAASLLSSNEQTTAPDRLSPASAEPQQSERLVPSRVSPARRARLILSNVNMAEDVPLELVPSPRRSKPKTKPLVPSHAIASEKAPLAPIEDMLLALRTKRRRNGKGRGRVQPQPGRATDPDWIAPFDQHGMPTEALRNVLLALARAPSEIDVDDEGMVVASRRYQGVGELLDIWRDDAGVQPLASEVVARAGRVGRDRWPEKIAAVMEQHARMRAGGRDADTQDPAPSHTASARDAARLRRARLNPPNKSDRERAGTPLAIEAIPSRDWFEANPMTSYSADVPRTTIQDREQLSRLKKIDAYVVDLGDGPLDLHPKALKAIGGDAQWLARPEIQEELRIIHAEQQRVISAMAEEADRRPLAFKKTGRRFWPRDLDPRYLDRLDRWAADPSFEHDMFAVEQRIYQAHAEHERRQRQRADAADRTPAPAKLSQPIPDGFGGWRDTPVPHFTGSASPVRIAAFDVTDKPTPQLLLLLRLAGENPRTIEFATDGRLMAGPDAPAAMAPLLHGWRHDERVEHLVVATARASRDAGRPVWPSEIASAVRAFATTDIGSVRPGRSRDDELSR